MCLHNTEGTVPAYTNSQASVRTEPLYTADDLEAARRAEREKCIAEIQVGSFMHDKVFADAVCAVLRTNGGLK